MELQDLFLAPFYLGLFYALAYLLRPRLTNAYTRPYFIPALTVKFVGAIALGLIFQFYYKGGDTFNYYTQGRVIYSAFGEDFGSWLKLLAHASGDYDPQLARYSSQIPWFNAPTEFFVVRLSSLLGLLCFNTYTVIGLFFAVISFSGMWVMYLTFVRIAPGSYKQLAFAVFFLPSVFFWGSGLMKDSLCVGALGWLFYGFYYALILRRNQAGAAVLGGLGVYVLVSVKIYILLSFLPPALFWLFNEYNQRIRSGTVRLLVRPLFLLLGAGAAYLGATNLTAGDARYDVNKIGERTKINQQFLYALTKDQGSAYNIGTFDGSLGSMVRVAPQAVVVTLFRPFLWEARNPVMLLSALEALMFTVLTVRLFFNRGLFKGIAQIASQPILTFCFLFSIILSIAVGTNSGNFGTLVRYKIPLMPFYLAGLYIMQRSQKPVAVRSPRRPAAPPRPRLVPS